MVVMVAMLLKVNPNSKPNDILTGAEQGIDGNGGMGILLIVIMDYYVYTIPSGKLRQTLVDRGWKISETTQHGLFSGSKLLIYQRV